MVESVVALALAATLILSLTYALGSGLKGVRDTKLFQQGTALGTRAVERARDTSYDKLVNRTTDLAGDAAVTSSAGVLHYDPDGSGSLQAERVVHNAAGDTTSPANTHVDTQTVDGATFTISMYVTWVDEDSQGGPSNDYKRFSAVVRWSSATGPHTYRTSTFITRTMRGLPVPKFELSPTTLSKTTSPDTRVSFGHSIRNGGINDAYDLRMPAPAGKPWTIQFFRDVDQDGLYTQAADGTTPLGDDNGDGNPETPVVATGQTVHFVATWVLPANEVSGSSNLTLTVSSGADGTVSTTATDTVTVVGGSGSTVLYLHNKPTPPVADTTAQTQLTMDATVPTNATLPRYSTDHDTARPGRFVDQSTPSVGQTSTNLHVAWNHTLGSSGVTFSGVPSVRIWVARRDFACTPDLQFVAYLRQKVNAASTSTESGRVVQATGTFTPVGTVGDCQFGEVVFNLPAINWNVPGTRALELKIVTSSASGAAGLYAYDTTTYPSRLVLP